MRTLANCCFVTASAGFLVLALAFYGAVAIIHGS